jgi:hypothetical protein
MVPAGSGGCTGDGPRDPDAMDTSSTDATSTTSASMSSSSAGDADGSAGTEEDDPPMDMGPAPDVGAPGPPMEVEPCGPGSCWSTLTFSGICGSTAIDEDFSSGNYNVHQFALAVRAGTGATLTLTRTGGAFEPALIVHDELGATVYDGELGLWSDELVVEAIETGHAGDVASVHIQPEIDMQLTVFATGWSVIDGGFASPLPTDATYAFEVLQECPPETGTMTPPNFDEGDVVGGYNLLPDSQPPGLYEHKVDDCSRGTQRLIEVLYTVASRFHELRPELTPIQIYDLNEAAACSTVDHETHDDGTHADLSAGCATDVACANWIPAVDLARLFVDTGEVCGIIFNDPTVQATINPYFESTQGYAPWNGGFMRSVDGHDTHFHVRVKQPDGTCN